MENTYSSLCDKCSCTDVQEWGQEVQHKCNIKYHQVMGIFFYPSTQRHYCRLILLLILLYCYMFRSYDHHQAENILIARITQLTTDPLLYNIANIIVLKLVVCILLRVLGQVQGFRLTQHWFEYFI
jgi:hypothetical protein